MLGPSQAAYACHCGLFMKPAAACPTCAAKVKRIREAQPKRNAAAKAMRKARLDVATDVELATETVYRVKGWRDRGVSIRRGRSKKRRKRKTRHDDEI